MAYVRLIRDVSDALKPLATEIVMDALNTGVISYDQIIMTAQVNPNAFADVLDMYITRHRSLLLRTGGLVAEAKQQGWRVERQGEVPTVKEMGWIGIGAFYWDFSRMTQVTTNMIKEVSISTSNKVDPKIVNKNEMRAVFKNLEVYLNQKRLIDTGLGSVAAIELAPKFMSAGIVSAPFSGGAMDEDKEQVLANTLSQMESQVDAKQKKMSLMYKSTWSGITGDVTDPMTSIVDLGNTLISAAVYAGAAKVALDALIASGKAMKSGPLGGLASLLTGGGSSAILAALFSVMKNLALLFIAIIISSIALGVFMAYYIPMIPMIHWLMGVIGYFALLIEVTLIAPVLAASHAAPEGRGITGERAKQGYMIIINLFLRPPLMVFGFFAALILTMIAGLAVLSLFGPFIQSALQTSLVTMLIQLTATSVVIIMVLIAVVTRSFQMINEVPDKALRFIGGGSESLGEGGAMGQSQSNFMLAGGVFQGAAQAITGGPTKPKDDKKEPKPKPDKSTNGDLT
jgi:conjugal transfer/type IV secretion protein DotA/TraY